jgi:hypothetical protein
MRENNITSAPVIETNAIDAARGRVLEAEIARAVQAVASKLGVTVAVDTKELNLPDGAALFTVRCTPGYATDAERDAFTDLGKAYGMEPWMLDETFEHDSKTWRVAGLRPRSGNRPIICQDIDSGARWAFQTGVGRLLREQRREKENF